MINGRCGTVHLSRNPGHTLVGNIHIFVSVGLTPEIYQTWRENGSTASTQLLGHIRTLNCRKLHPFGALHSDYFGSLRRLQHLALRDIIQIEPIISNLSLVFQHTLSLLSLCRVSLTCNAFIGLIGYFPNLRELHFNQSSVLPDSSPAPTISRPPRGKLCLSMLRASDIDILSHGISGLELEYDELQIVDVFDRPPWHTQLIVTACKKTLRRLRVNNHIGMEQHYALEVVP